MASARGLGPRGRRFESFHPDQVVTDYLVIEHLHFYSLQGENLTVFSVMGPRNQNDLWGKGSVLGVRKRCLITVFKARHYVQMCALSSVGLERVVSAHKAGGSSPSGRANRSRHDEPGRIFPPHSRSRTERVACRGVGHPRSAASTVRLYVAIGSQRHDFRRHDSRRQR